MEARSETLITRCRDLAPGDVIEAWINGKRYLRGRVNETMPGCGLFWIHEAGLNERRLLDMGEMDIVRILC